MLRIRAGSVHPVTAPPISDGAVLVDDAGKIAAVGPHPRVPTPPGARALEFPDAALAPGLVNCHTHLELTHLAGRNPEPAFAAWIRRIRELKDATPPEEFRRSAEQGVRDCWTRGVTCVADTGSTGAVVEALARLGGRGIAYHEVFGPDPARCAASIAELEQALGWLSRFASSHLRLGVSPHAPYTVSEPLYRAVADFARREGLPVAVHLAESREEVQLVREGSGPFAEALRARGIAVEPRGLSPVEYLLQLGVLASGVCLGIHCVQVDEPDVRILRGGGGGGALPALEPRPRPRSDAGRRPAGGGRPGRARHRFGRERRGPGSLGRGGGSRMAGGGGPGDVDPRRSAGAVLGPRDRFVGIG